MGRCVIVKESFSRGGIRNDSTQGEPKCCVFIMMSVWKAPACGQGTVSLPPCGRQVCSAVESTGNIWLGRRADE